MGMKTVLDGMKAGMIVEGLVPFYPNGQTTAIQVNNSASQQTAFVDIQSPEEIRRLKELYDSFI
jgi:hypothetical protein